MTTIKGAFVNDNPDGTLEVGFLIDGTIQYSKIMTPAQVLEAANPIHTYEEAVSICLASWLGVDPTASDRSKLLDFTVEIDFSQVQAVRRVLPL